MRALFLFLTANLFAATAAFSQNQPASVDSLAAAKPINKPQARVERVDPVSAIEERLDSKITRIKINPLVILSGDMPLYIEHEIKPRLSAELGIGSTYDNMLSDIFEGGNPPDLSIDKEGLNSFSVAAGLRHYPSEMGTQLEGYYFAPEVRFRDYRSVVNAVGGEPVELKQSRQILDGKFVLGYVNHTNGQIFFDMYAGIGMRYKFYRDRIENYAVIYDPNTNQTSTQLKLSDELRRGLLLSLGFKVGFSF